MRALASPSSAPFQPGKALEVSGRRVPLAVPGLSVLATLPLHGGGDSLVLLAGQATGSCPVTRPTCCSVLESTPTGVRGRTRAAATALDAAGGATASLKSVEVTKDFLLTTFIQSGFCFDTREMRSFWVVNDDSSVAVCLVLAVGGWRRVYVCVQLSFECSL